LRRTVDTCLSLLAVLVLFVTSAAAAGAHESTAHFMKTVKEAHGGASKPRAGANLISHGGPVESSVKVFIIYWGPDWTSGSYSAARSYVEGFFGNAGGSNWANSTSQYCQGVPSGTVQCGSAGVHPSNLPNQLGGTWNDTSALPGTITQSGIAAEAAAGAAHFGYNANADYMVFTPSGHSQSGFGTQWCAYHSATSTSSGNLSYAYIPFQPDAGVSCGQNFVNSGSAGLFDGFSIVGGHEYAETITDPFPNSGWLDSRGAENGDKCAWISSGQGAAANINLGGSSYAVQSLWSNAFNGGTGGCVLSY
jgi:serine protease